MKDSDDDSTSSEGSSFGAGLRNARSIAVSLTPSHVLQDGTFVHLPSSTDSERTRFFERSIARYGLLQDDLNDRSAAKTKEANDADSTVPESDIDEKKKKSIPKIHPLALASARIQANGINELNRAINLHTLVASGEYFGLSNIVDPSLERVTTSSNKEQSDTVATRGDNIEIGDLRTKGPIGNEIPRQGDEAAARVQSLYILKRKRAQFEQASIVLKRHYQRLLVATVAQQQVDRRLCQLRPVWSLVAPEHGTRALPHAVKPTEVICADLDVYSGIKVGRLASRVPRYSTVELREDYTVDADLKDWNEKHSVGQLFSAGGSQMNVDVMDARETAKDLTHETYEFDDAIQTSRIKYGTVGRSSTCAEPFVIVDPSLGKTDTTFDPTKATILTLRFDLEKPSTRFCATASLEPFRPGSMDPTTKYNSEEDEELMFALQHSLLCAKLFESIRREIAPDTENVGQIRTTAKAQSTVWLTGEPDENLLPSSGLMISGQNSVGLTPLALVHVHEGDVKVLLDCEYTLRVRLFESGGLSSPKQEQYIGKDNDDTSGRNSGSESPEYLDVLCKALLLHAQETYHVHSIQTEKTLQMEQIEEERRQSQFRKDNPNAKIVPNPLKRKEVFSSPCTLQSCVSLGTKMLFERRIRGVLKRIKLWLLTATSKKSLEEEPFLIEWVALSVFDLTAHFTVSYQFWSIDANIVCDELTVTRFGEHGEYLKAKFHSDTQFELFLTTALRRELTRVKQQVAKTTI